MPIDIRAAEAADAEAIARLNRHVQAKHTAALPWLFKDEPLSVAAAGAMLEGPRNLVLMAQEAGEGVGYIYAEFRSFPETPYCHAYATAHIHHIAVAPAYRRRGVGRALMQRVVEAAKARGGVDRLTADFWAFNEESRAFFAGFGLAPYMIRAWCALR